MSESDTINICLWITVVTHHGLWQLTDHLLSRDGVVLPDISLKNMHLEAEDAKAMIAYAGLGKVKNMQISDWVSGVLRGKRRNLVDHMRVLRDASSEKLLPISKDYDTPHTFSIAAYENSQPTLYVITNRIIKKRKTLCRR